MSLIALAMLALGGYPAPSSPRGTIAVEVTVAKKGVDDALVIQLRNVGPEPAKFEYSESPCSSTELATVAYHGEGAIGRPLERVGIVEEVLMRELTIAPNATYSCTFSISHWYWNRWKPDERSKVKIFWSFEPSRPGIYEKNLYGGVVKLP